VDEPSAISIVIRALEVSYPTWIDEYGTNIEQLATIAVAALAADGLLVGGELVLDGGFEHDPVST